MRMSAAALIKLAKTLGGFYKGQPADPDSVKKTVKFQGIEIQVDRPKGFIMFGVDSKGKEWRRKYQTDYGFIPQTLGGDDDGLDVFIGPNKESKQAFWAVQRKDDGSFDEYKIFLGFDTREEAMETYRQHIPKKYFGRMIVTTVDMMRAMLGKNPDEAVKMTKSAMWDGFFTELRKMADSAYMGYDYEPELPLKPEPPYPMREVVPPSPMSLDHPGHTWIRPIIMKAALGKQVLSDLFKSKPKE